MFWSPPQCPNTLLHNSADPKPFLNVLQFRAPPAGTGDITFLALIKTGPANHGYFYHPNLNADLTLKEGPVRGSTWTLTTQGDSCESACRSQGGIATTAENSYASASSADGFKEAVSREHLCKFPIVRDCSAASPFKNTDGTCFYHADDCQEDVHEKARLRGYQRFCHCAAPKEEKRARRSFTNAASSSRTASFPVFLFCGIAFLMFGDSHRGRGLVLLALALTLMAPSASAHNWLHTPGRASREASTTRPCRARKSSDTHAQLGPGQQLTFKWATGHNRDVYIVVLAGQDEQWLRHRSFTSFVNEYIEEAPRSLHMQDGHQRVHGQNSDNPERLGFYEESDMYRKKITSESDRNYLDHPNAVTKHLYQYSSSVLESDRRVSYRSSKYPWIVSAMRYNIQYHLPGDYDAVKIDIPARSGPGHYIVHYRWGGYYDCKLF